MKLTCTKQDLRYHAQGGAMSGIAKDCLELHEEVERLRKERDELWIWQATTINHAPHEAAIRTLTVDNDRLREEAAAVVEAWDEKYDPGEEQWGTPVDVAIETLRITAGIKEKS